MNEILIYNDLPSTNEFAINSQNLKHGDGILAYKQTKGRGQNGRAWQSNLGGLYLSIILKDIELNNITLKIGKLVKKYLDEYTNQKFEIKLPNDILYKGEKICGVLVESRTCGDSVLAVCGIGLNINNNYNNYNNLSSIMGKEQDILKIAKKIRECILNEI